MAIIDYLLIQIFAGQFLLSTQHCPCSCDQTEANSSGRNLHVPESCEGYHGPCAPAGDPVCCVSLEALKQDSWEDLRLCHALSDSLPGEETNMCVYSILYSPTGFIWWKPMIAFVKLTAFNSSDPTKTFEGKEIVYDICFLFIDSHNPLLVHWSHPSN